LDSPILSKINNIKKLSIKTKYFMSKSIVYFIIFVIILGIFGYFSFNIYKQIYLPPNQMPSGEYSFELKTGQNITDIAKKFDQDGLINSQFGFVMAEKLKPIANLQTGSYNIELENDSPQELLQKIDDESFRIQEAVANIGNRPTATITFREGETLDQIIVKLSENKVVNKDQLITFAKNPDNFNRERYPFLPEPLTCEYGNMQNCAKYYPEGYLYPDTYEFFLESTPNEVFDKLLSNFNNRVWSKLENKPNPQTFYKAMIMASVIEKETGRTRGVNQESLAEVNKERKIMAGVFQNRIAQNMKWQSDPTASYGHGKPICQQTFKIEGCIFLNDPSAQTLYNTYKIEGYPIGPVTSPQYDNIIAALEPDSNNYLFFVSDVVGKKYFSRTNSEHEQQIQRVQQINRDLGL
jgi:UPF0755 protein